MRFKTHLIAIGCVLSLSAVAGTMGSIAEEYRPWSIIGSLGYTWYDKFYDGGPTADPFAQPAIRNRYTTTFTGNISNIPAQNGILLSLSYSV